jgi:hypothetical protein
VTVLVFNAEILRCVSRRVRSEANAGEKASAHFAQDDRYLDAGECLGGFSSKPRDLGNHRGYRVAKV